MNESSVMTFEDYCQKRKDPGWSFGFVDFKLAAVAVLGPHAWAWYRVRLGLLVAFPTVLLVWISVHAGWHYLIWIPYFFWITLISGTGFSLIDMLRAIILAAPFAILSSIVGWDKTSAWVAFAGCAWIPWVSTFNSDYCERFLKYLETDRQRFDCVKHQLFARRLY